MTAALFERSAPTPTPTPGPNLRPPSPTYWLVRGGPYGAMWYGGPSRSVIGHPRWRLWAKDAERFPTLDRAVETARRWDGRVEARP
ncbi:MAG: hypothetical protein AAF602_22985 [Myxococcota bacterium]